jgi:hypothetical protein
VPDESYDTSSSSLLEIVEICRHLLVHELYATDVLLVIDPKFVISDLLEDPSVDFRRLTNYNE